MQTKLLEIEYFFILFSLSFRKIINNKDIAKKETKKKKKKKEERKIHTIRFKSFLYQQKWETNAYARVYACTCMSMCTSNLRLAQIG